MDPIRLSATKFGKLASPDFCQFCFWVYLQIDQKAPFDSFPGIFSSIDRYTKAMIHAYMDKHHKLPACLEGFEDAVGYLEVGRLKHFDEESGILITGEPDDVFTLTDECLALADYKTARYPKALAGGDKSESSMLLPSYGVQLNVYDYLLEKNDFPKCQKASLIYFDPTTALSAPEFLDRWDDLGFSLGFQAKVLPVELNHKEILPPLFARVRKVYELEKAPRGRAGCKNCERIENMLALAGKGIKLEDARYFSDLIGMHGEFGLTERAAVRDAFVTLIGW